MHRTGLSPEGLFRTAMKISATLSIEDDRKLKGTVGDVFTI